MLNFLLGLAVGWAFAMATALFILRQVGAKATATPTGAAEPDYLAEPDNPEEEDELTRYRRERERGFFA